MFDSYNPPRLAEPVYFYVASWYEDSVGPIGRGCNLDEVEKEMITLASAQFAGKLLNTSGVRRQGR